MPSPYPSFANHWPASPIRRVRAVQRALAASIVGLVLFGCGDGGQSPTASPSSASPVTAAATATAGVPLSFRHLSVGAAVTCGVTTADQAYCWGYGRVRPVPVSGGLRFLEVSAGVNDGGRGSSPSCGVTVVHRAYCWVSDLVPVEVPGGRRFRQLSVGRGYICGVTTLDIAFCWGDNEHGQLGTGGGYTTAPTRVAGGLRWRRVFAADSHTCGTTLDDRAYCWGAGNLGQLGIGRLGNDLFRSKPVAVAGGLRFRQVKPGSGYDGGINSVEIDRAITCGVTTEDRVYCWGNTALGSATEQSSTPVAVAGGRRYLTVHPGQSHACALTSFHFALCWGDNTDGQLGTGSGTSSTAPTLVSSTLQFENLTVGPDSRTTCGVTLDNRGYCWGSNYGGMLGDGTTTNRPTPTPVAAPL